MAQFKNAGRKKKVILQHLESLEFLGILISRRDENITYWHNAELGEIAS
ncbi:hypothetical protein JJD41_01550 [Oxynema sp. CENA135]|nr:hypothetical protein [Oxynema sp. CENA135]MBK4728574.1 hypothetical protein [Oxynema sp. CENA135]